MKKPHSSLALTLALETFCHGLRITVTVRDYARPGRAPGRLILGTNAQVSTSTRQETETSTIVETDMHPSQELSLPDATTIGSPPRVFDHEP